MVTSSELAELRQAIARGELPSDLTAKLNSLSRTDLGQHFIEQNCRLFTELLLASFEGSFTEASGVICDRLLRVLAYVRKDDDYIPDYRPDGFADDRQEIRRAAEEFNPLLQNFKVWRLRHQVPRLWMISNTAHRQHPQRNITRIE